MRYFNSNSCSKAASQLHRTVSICKSCAACELHVTLQWNGSFWWDFWKMLLSVRYWGESKGDMAYAVKRWASQLQSPSPPPLWAETRTWWKLEAQFWASAAWALSVSCLSVLFSTVTLPSPICLTNRRNYTTVGGKKEVTARQHWQMLIGHVCTNILLVSFQTEMTEDSQKMYQMRKDEEIDMFKGMACALK